MAPICMVAGWNGRFSNVIDNARYAVKFYEGFPPWPGYYTFNEEIPRGSVDLQVDVDASDNLVWYEAEGMPQMSTLVVMEFLAKKFLEKIEALGKAK